MIYEAAKERYAAMRYTRSGDSGLKLPAISLGFWHNFGDRATWDNMRAMCFAAFDSGVTHFDFANNYGPEYGAAEANGGRLIETYFKRYRDELIVSTKAGYDMWEGPYGRGGSRKYLLSSLDQSLKRLKLDYVDIFYHHVPDADVPLEETMGALATAVQSGKALYVGLSNYDGPTMEKAAAILNDLKVPFVINQNSYNIFNRTVEQNGLKEKAAALKKGLIAFCPLAQGLLTDRYLNGIPADSRIKADSRFLNSGAITETYLTRARALNELAAERGQSLAQMALAWVLFRGATSVLIGASSPKQILENVHALDHPDFSAEELARIDTICGIKNS